MGMDATTGISNETIPGFEGLYVIEINIFYEPQ